MKKILKNILKKFGLNISRVQTWENNYQWLQDYRIEHVIDIGANVGQFARHINEILPDAKIYSFEPIPYEFAKLKDNTSGLPITYYQYALGAELATAEIFVNEYSPSSSLLDITEDHRRNFDFAQKSKPLEIEVRSLDSFPELNGLSDLLVKIDVQGFEDQVIKGAVQVLQSTSVVFCEVSFKALYKDQKLFDEIYALFCDLGFLYKGNIDQVFDKDNGEILYADAVFVNQNKL